MPEAFHATTILAVRAGNKLVLAGDGQVTLGQTVMKHNARKVRRLYQGRVLAGFAGAAADAFTLFEKFEQKLESVNGNLRRAAVELAKDWRTDRMLRRLEALLIVADRESTLLISGQRRRDRARRRHHRDRLGRQLRARRRQGARQALDARRPRRSPRRRCASRPRSASTPTISSSSRSCRRDAVIAGTPRHAPDAPHTMTPREIVSELDRYIVGQRAAKRAVAIALRNRWRRQQVPEDLRDEIAPEEHHHDRPDRRRQDRDLAPPRQARAARPSSRSRPRSSPRSATSAATSSRSSATWPSSRSAWSRRRRRTRCACAPARSPRSALLDLLLPSGPTPAAGSDAPPGATPPSATSREKLPALAARGQARRPHGRARGHQAACRRWSRS